MKIIVNKIAATQRTNKIVETVIKEAKEAAHRGKVDFWVQVSLGELNGLDSSEIKRLIHEESEGTILCMGDFGAEGITQMKIVES